MPESLPLNNDPLNQAAKQHLKEVGEVPEPTGPYLIQLAEWGLSRPEITQSEPVRTQMLEMISVLHRTDPAKAFRFLEGSREDPESVRIQAANLRDRTPIEAAKEALEALHSAMVATLPDYPEPRMMP